MIVLHRPSWWRLLTVWRGSALARVWPRLLIVTAVSQALTLLHTYGRLDFGISTPLPFTVFGLALGIFLGFRNNASYDRFWEGRKLWGQLVNVSRTSARQILTLIADPGQPQLPSDDQRRLVYGVAAFPHLLRAHLRREGRVPEALTLLPTEVHEAIVQTSHRPVAVLQLVGTWVTEAWRRGHLDTLHLPIIEASLTRMADILGGCERIRNTPIPVSYTVVMHRLVALYVMALPFGLFDAVGTYTPIVVLITAYAFLGLDAIGDELENPFGTDPNDLPLTHLCHTIETNLRELLGDTDLPSPPFARDHIVS